ASTWKSSDLELATSAGPTNSIRDDPSLVSEGRDPVSCELVHQQTVEGGRDLWLDAPIRCETAPPKRATRGREARVFERVGKLQSLLPDFPLPYAGGIAR